MTRRTASRFLLPAVALAACAALASPGCSASGPETPEPQAPGASRAAPAAVLASATLETLPLRVELARLAREGDGVVALECALVNTSATDEVAIGGIFAAAPQDTDTVSGVSLLQDAAPKRFFMLRDEEGRPVCTRDIGVVAPGERRVVTAKFPAPSTDVDHVTVEFPGLPAFRNVAIAPAAGTRDR